MEDSRRASDARTIPEPGSLGHLRAQSRRLPGDGYVAPAKLLCDEKRLDQALHLLEQHTPEPLDTNLISRLLRACAEKKDLPSTRRLRSIVDCHGFLSIPFFANQFIRILADCGDLQSAQELFSSLSRPTVHSWNAIICAHSKIGRKLEAFELYDAMFERGFWPDKYTYLGVLKACTCRNDLEQVRLLHSSIIKSGLDLIDIVIGNVLLDTYMKCETLGEGHSVFELMPHRDVVTWASMMKGYVQCGQGDLTLELYEEMYHEGIQPDGVVLSTVLKACSSVANLWCGRLVHHHIIKYASENDIVVANTLIDMYIKCGSLKEGRNLFDALQRRDVISWNAVISGCCEFGCGPLAFSLLERMQKEGMTPNVNTFASILKVCGSIGAIRKCRVIHGVITCNNLAVDVILEVSLVDAYAKCGSFRDAYEVLSDDRLTSVQAWNALISGCADHGLCKLAAQYLDDMERIGMQPNRRTYTSILAACSHAGQVDEGRKHFYKMIEIYGITPDLEHFNCMIDLLGRAGRLHEADELLQTAPNCPGICGWRSLLASCRVHGQINLGKECYGQTVSLYPEDASGYMLMSNMHADACKWDDMQTIQKLRMHAAAWKKPGSAFIELNDEVYEFIVGENFCLRSERKLLKLSRDIRLMGFVPQVEAVLTWQKEE